MGGGRWGPKIDMISQGSVSACCLAGPRKAGKTKMGVGGDLPKMTQWVSGGAGIRLFSKAAQARNIRLTITLLGGRGCWRNSQKHHDLSKVTQSFIRWKD